MFEQLIITYNETGRARKKCSNVNCSKYVHAKSLMCVCGFEFKAGAHKYYESKANEVVKINVSEENGKGRKQCNGCKGFVGVRTLICKCGFDFSNYKKPDKERINTIADEDRQFGLAFGYPNPRSYVYAPSGEFKIPKNPEGFETFVERYICSDGRLMTPCGFRYILRANGGKHLIDSFNNWLYNDYISSHKFETC